MNVNTLINEISDESVSLSQVFLKVKVLIHGLNNKDLDQWIENELQGYKDGSKLPEYRIVPARVMATFQNVVQRFTHHPIPLNHLDDGLRESLERVRIGMSVSALEDLYKTPDANGMATPVPFEMFSLLAQGLDDSYQILSANREIPKPRLYQILTTIRSRLLNALLDMKDSFGGSENIGEEDVKKNKSAISAFFNSAMFGDNATIIIGENNTQNVSITSIKKGDFDSLSSFLKRNGVEQGDIQSLKIALSEDGDRKESSTFGNKVNGWMKSMLSKAVDGAWQINVGTAAGMLVEVLKKHYGQ